MSSSPASAASGIQAFMDLFTLMSVGPTRAELKQDYAELNSNRNLLVPKLFDGRRYDRREPSHYPVEVTSFLFVDHIEQLNELEQTLTFHGTSILMWEDRRLVWEPGDYGNLDRIAFSDVGLLRFWMPTIKAKGVTVSNADLIRYYSSRLLLLSTGRVAVESGVSLKASCNVDLENYPYDNQTCFVLLYSPGYPSAKLLLSHALNLPGRDSMFAAHNLSMMVGYRLTEVVADSVTIFRGMVINGTLGSPGKLTSFFTNSVLRYQLRLERNTASYILQVAIPLYAMVVATFVCAVWLAHSDSILSASSLAFCLLLQLIDLDRLMQILPSDYDSEPRCATFAKILLLQTVMLLVYRCAIPIIRATGAKYRDGRPVEKSIAERVERVEYWLKYALIVEGVLCFWWLFC